MKSFTRLFSFADIFKYKFFFRVGSSIENSTFFSVFISLFILAPLLAYFILLTLSILKHETVQINVQEFDVNDRPFMNLSRNNFRLGFRIINRLVGQFSDNLDDYFDVTITYKKIFQNESGFKTERTVNFGLKPCAEENFSDFKTYYTRNLKKAFCVDFHEAMEIGGYWDEERVGTLDFNLKKCGSTILNKTNCLPLETVQDQLFDSYFYVYIESQDVDALNYNYPLKKSMKTYFQTIDFTMRKEFLFFIEEVELETYDNFIYNTEPKRDSFNKQINMVADSETHNKRDNNTIIRMQIFSSNKVQKIERTYLTIIEAAAIVGGISSFVLALGTVITFLYNDMNLKIKLINQLYTFDLETAVIKNSNIKPKENIQLFSQQESKVSRLFKQNVLKINHLKAISRENVETDELDIPDELNGNDKKIMKSKMTKRINSSLFSQSQQIQLPEKGKNGKNVAFDIEESTNNRPKREESESNKSAKNIEESLNNRQKKEESAPKKFGDLLVKKELFFLGETQRIMNPSQGINLSEIPRKIVANHLKSSEFKKTTKLKFSIFEMIRCIFLPFALSFKLKHKFKLYEKACGLLMNYINIFHMVKIVDEVQKLKSILLNNHQLVLFNYLSKPHLSLNKEESKEDYLSNLEQVLAFANDNKKEDFAPEIISYYKELTEKKNWSVLDVKLFDYLDQNFKKLLKSISKS